MIEGLQAALLAADVAGVRRELAALDDAGRAAARRWVKTLGHHPWEERAYPSANPEEMQRNQFLSHAVLVLGLLSPKQALEKLHWSMCTERLLSKEYADERRSLEVGIPSFGITTDGTGRLAVPTAAVPVSPGRCRPCRRASGSKPCGRRRSRCRAG